MVLALLGVWGLPSAPSAAAADEVVLVNGLPLESDGDRLDGCTISVDVSGLAGTDANGVPIDVVITAIPPTVPEETTEVLVTEQTSASAASWHRDFDMTALLQELPAKPNGYRLSVAVSVDSVEMGELTAWLACGAAQEGSPARILFDVTWIDADGAPIDAPLDTVLPAGWRDDYRLTATSERGDASCGYPAGSDLLVCEYDNPGHGTRPGLVVPGGKHHTYTVTQTALPEGWTVDESTLGTFLGRDTCPKGDGHHDADAAAEHGEEGGRTCVHAVRNLQLAVTPPVTPVTPVTPPPSEVGPTALVAGESAAAALPATGTTSIPLVLLALSLMATGTVLQLAANRRWEPLPAAPAHLPPQERP